MLTKGDIAKEIAGRRGMTQAKAMDVVNDIFTTITDSLSKGDEVRLTGFGTFRIAEREARPGRNPRTGEPIQIPASRRPTFTSGSGLSEAVRSGKAPVEKPERGRQAA
ncbi:MAG: HU family DNA-binding protein [Chloroflexi bacterium]|nr:HU family DNA-binding protein [Chloroflexota bacterium]